VVDTTVHESGRGDDAAAVVQPGEVIAGKYEVVKILGSGGMGVVVAARHVELGSRVAIKFLKPELVADELSMARFMREARAAVSLTSEHVARVMDVGKLESGAPYMIMELLRGVDLETLLEQHGRLPIEQAVDFVLQACVALAEAHALGLVHRDLKPANLFLTEMVDGSPLIKVLDFGIAKTRQSAGKAAHNLTATGVALGTPSYMAPEQVRAAKDVDRRADIWGLGVVLHQLVGGAPPFDAETMPALCAKIIADAPVRLSAACPGVPAELEAVVARCLEKRVEQRYANVAVLARALAPFASGAARRLVERIERIVGGRTSLVPVDTGWQAFDSMAHTVASAPRLEPAEAATSSSEAEHEGPSPIEEEQAAAVGAPATSEAASVGGSAARIGDTAGAWQADAGATGGARRSRRGLVFAVALLLPLAAVLLWVAPWRATAPTDTAAVGPSADLSAALVERAGVPQPSAAPQPAVSLIATAEPQPTASATASAGSVAEPRAKAPQYGRPSGAPPRGGRHKATPRGTSASPSTPPKPYDLLDERK